MGTYNLQILGYGTFSVDSPRLTIWNDGFLDTNHLIAANGTSVDRSLSFGGALPSSVFFTFNDGSAEAGREINFRTLKINDRYINEKNFLTTDILVNGQASQIDLIDGDFLFDESEPSLGLFTSPTMTLDNNVNSIRYLGAANYVLDGLGGNDIFYMGSGNDQLFGNDGNDRIFAGSGNDLLMGGDGRDKLVGQDGDDELYGGAGDDKLFGDDGHDHLFGGEGNDKLYGNDGDDILVGQAGNDNLNGSFGDDIIYGDAGNDTLIGGNGIDTLDGGADTDLLYGGNGDDILYGGAGNDTIFGDVGNDVLHGNEGDDILSGKAGNDILYGGTDGKKSLSGGDGEDILMSMSNFSITAEINDILANNTGVSYSSDTNSFYQLITGSLTWAAAQSSAQATSLIGLTGVQGDIVTITTQMENDFVETIANGNDIWIGASDSVTEGNWNWLSGVENGIQFWAGGSGGNTINSQYENWGFLSPAGLLADQDYAYMDNGGDWAVDRAVNSNAYVVEWDAADLVHISDPITFMNGGSGADELYGQDGGIDRFMINTIDAIDDIFNFNIADRDQIHLGNIINYNALNDDISDFLAFTEIGGNTMISIDSDGTVNGSSFTDVAQINDSTGLDLALLIASDNILL